MTRSAFVACIAVATILLLNAPNSDGFFHFRFGGPPKRQPPPPPRPQPFRPAPGPRPGPIFIPGGFGRPAQPALLQPPAVVPSIAEIKNMAVPANCRFKRDVTFIVDRSGSMAHDMWNKGLVPAWQGLVHYLMHDGMDTRIAAVGFDVKADLLWKFGDLQTKDEVLRAIANTRYTGGGTRTGWAFKMVAEQINPLVRPDVPHLIILISDGGTNQGWFQHADQWNDAMKRPPNTKVVSIGVKTFDYNKGLLDRYATSATSEHREDVETYYNLYPTIQRLGQMCCKVFPAPPPPPPTTTTTTTPPPPPTTTTPTPDDGPLPVTTTTEAPPPPTTTEVTTTQPPKTCPPDVKLDVTLLVDDSGSIGETAWYHLIHVVRGFIKSLRPGSKDNKQDDGINRVAIYQFSNTMEKTYKLTWDQSPWDLHDAVDRMRYRTGETYTELALDTVREDIVPTVRPGVTHLCVLITDGDPSPGQDAQAAADRLKATGTKLMVIGVGSEIKNPEQMDKWSSGPDKYRLNANDYHSLKARIHELTAKVCNPQ